MEQAPSKSQKVAVFGLLSITVVALLGLAMVTGIVSKLRAHKLRFYVAFKESVSGLRLGSDVTYAGVPIGTVEEMYPRDAPGARDIGGDLPPEYTALVLVEVDEDKIDRSKPVKAVLEMTSLVGGLAVRIDPTDPEKEKGRPVPQPNGVLPAEPSAVAELTKRLFDKDVGLLSEQNKKKVDDILSNLKSLSGDIDQLVRVHEKDFAQIASSTAAVTKNLEDWTSRGGRLELLVDRLSAAAENVKTVFKDDVPDLVKELKTLSEDVRKTSEAVTATAGTADSVLLENRERVAMLMEDMSRLTRRMDQVLAQIDQEPASLIVGRKGPEVGASREGER